MCLICYYSFSSMIIPSPDCCLCPVYMSPCCYELCPLMLMSLQVGVAIGCAARDRTVAFASTFAAFLSRAYDQIRMGAISQTNVNLVGSHCGVSIGKFTARACSWTMKQTEQASLTDHMLPLGEDGPSQMALEDLAMFRAIPTCTVFYPSDAVSAERAVELSANTKVRRKPYSWGFQ